MGDPTKLKAALELAQSNKTKKDEAIDVANKALKANLDKDNIEQAKEFDLKEKWIAAYEVWKAAKESKLANDKLITDTGNAVTAAK